MVSMACSAAQPGSSPVAPVVPEGGGPATTASAAIPAPAPEPQPPPGPPDEERTRLVTWMKSRLPEGGEIIDRPGSPVGVAHSCRDGDTFAKIAEAYLDFSE